MSDIAKKTRSFYFAVRMQHTLFKGTEFKIYLQVYEELCYIKILLSGKTHYYIINLPEAQ